MRVTIRVSIPDRVSKMSRHSLGPSIPWVPRALSLEVRRPAHRAIWRWRRYVVKTVGTKLYCCENHTGLSSSFITINVMHKFFIYLSIYFCLTCFGLSFSPSSGTGVQIRQWLKFAGYGDSRDLNHCRNCTPASEDGLKGSPKHVRQK
jgi:hypothetical protein